VLTLLGRDVFGAPLDESLESEMKNRFFYRPVLIIVIALTCCLLVSVLLVTTRSVGAIVEQERPPSVSSVHGTLLPRSTAAYNGVMTPSTVIYAPWLLGRTSVVRVYNAGEGQATVKATFAYAGGVTTTQRLLAAGAAMDIEPPSGVLTGTQLSAILTGTEPIVAVVNDFGLDRKQATSYAAMPASLGQDVVMVPDVFSTSGGGWDSQVLVQNVGHTPTGVTIVYTRTDEFASRNWTDSFSGLAPGAVHLFDPNDAGLQDFVGIATLKADRPLVAIVRNAATEITDPVPRQAYIYRVPLASFGGGSNRPLYFPLLVNEFGNWKKSEIQFMNAAPVGVGFNLEIFGEAASAMFVDPWWAVSERQDDDGRDPDWVEAGRVANAQSLHSLVWLEGDFEGDSFAAYTSPSVGARTWYLPYTDQRDDFVTYVAVQNLGDVPVHISRTYYDVTGTLPPITGDIIAGREMALYAAGSGFVGGVMVQADRPVVAVAVIAGRMVLDKDSFLPVVFRNN